MSHYYSENIQPQNYHPVNRIEPSYDYEMGKPQAPYHSSRSDMQFNDYQGLTPSMVGDEFSPYYGMDSRLAQFVSDHNIVMDDGAVAYAGPIDPNSKRILKDK